MKKPNKQLIIVIVIIVIIIIASILYFFKDKLFKKPQAPELDTDKLGNKITWTADEFPLKKGSSGIRVKQLQAALNILKNNNLSIDGKFGEKTLAALQEGYSVDSLSEANYNTYIKPNITAINDYIAKSHPANKPAADKTNTAAHALGLSTANVLGKSVSANKACQGFMAKADDDLEFVMNENLPVSYSSGQYVGVVEKEDNGWLRCMRSNGTRVFILKSNVKPI